MATSSVGTIPNTDSLEALKPLYYGNLNDKTLTMSFSAAASFMLVFNMSTTAAQGLYIVYGHNSTAPVFTAVQAISASGFTMSASGYNLRVKATSNIFMTIIPLNDSSKGRITITSA